MDQAQPGLDGLKENLGKRGRKNSDGTEETIKKLISSSYKGTFEDTRRLVEHQSVIFESVGEVPGGAVTGD